MRLAVALVLLAGCASPDFTHESEFWNQHSPQQQAKERDERKALSDYYMAEAKKSVHHNVTMRLRESRTNYPPYLLPH